MKPATYSYGDYFRGYVKTYHGAVMKAVNCKQVRKNRLLALEDAKKLLKKLRTTNH